METPPREVKAISTQIPVAGSVPSALRLKVLLLLFISALLAAVCGLMFVLVSQLFARLTPQLRADLAIKAQVASHLLAESAQTALVLRDPTLIDQQVAQPLRDRDLRTIALVDADGEVLAVRGDTTLPPAELFAGAPGEVREHPDYFSAWQLSEIEGARVGRVGVALSTARLRQGERLRGSIEMVALAGTLVALFLSLFFVNFYLGPLIRITERALANLRQLAATLEGRVQRRTAALQESNQQLQASLALLHQTQRELVESSRSAGAAEVATSVLHNVGNVLNSVNVSAGLVIEAVRGSKVDGVARAATLLAEHQADLPAFLTQDPRGKHLPAYLQRLGEALLDEQRRARAELEALQKKVDHVKVVVSMQQAHARAVGVIEEVKVEEMIDDALQMNFVAGDRASIEVVRDYAPLPPVRIDRHKLFQIVANLLSNARDALKRAPGERRLTVRTRFSTEARMAIVIEDTGVGVAPEHRDRIFAFGFTTKKDGHGFGLHSSALAARELGGTLTVASEGAGRGAAFTLELPLQGPEQQQAA